MNNIVLVTLNLLLLLAMTSLGALLVYFFTKPSKFLNIITNGFASGIMFSASIWSLLVPAIENIEKKTPITLLPVIVGFVLGGLFLVLIDKIILRFQKTKNDKYKAYKFFCAVTLHNIPEGLSVGFAFGSSAILGLSPVSAIAMTLGIAIQNIPEGLSISLPMYRLLKSKHKGFALGCLSGVVEPIFGFLGYFLATMISGVMPWLLSFSAGSMIFVVIEEFMPCLNEESGSSGTWSFIIGFLFMLLLDICF